MKRRGRRYWWAAIVLLFAVVAGAWWTSEGFRMRTKEYVLESNTGTGSPTRTGIKFVSPANFVIVPAFLARVVLMRVQPVGLAAWIEERLDKGRQTHWNNLSLWMQYRSDYSYGLEEQVSKLKDLHPGERRRRVRYRLGPALLFDDPSSNGQASHSMILFADASRARGRARSLRSIVFITYESPAQIDAQVRRVVDEIVSSMQIVPL